LICCTKNIEIPDTNYYKNRFTRVFYQIAVNDVFNTFIMVIIITNTVLLSLERYPEMEKDIQDVFDIINYIFTTIFTMEVIIKMIGLGIKTYVRDGFNLFDLFTVIISIIELLLSSGSGSLSALRAFRLFRVFKLFKADNLRVLIDSILFTLGTIGNYSVLLFLFIYVYAMLGMQLFAGKLRFNE
jgi:hypothetical protein